MSFSQSLKEKALSVWEAGYNHPFVQELGKGTLDKEKFKFYLIQDYYYLIEYAKVYALAAVKSDTEKLITQFTTVQYNILAQEMELHRNYMSSFGITEEDVKNTKPALFNRVYTANMFAVAQTGSVAEIMATIFPCAWTYSDYALRLKADYAGVLENNFYNSWIETYASSDFEDSFLWFFDTLDELCKNKTPEELKKIEDIFISSVEFEYLFWDMAYKKESSYKL